MKNLIKFDIPESKERNLFFNKQVDQNSIGELMEKIIEINELDEYLEKYYALHDLIYNRKPIKIFIDSYGGYVYQCFGLLSVMEKSKTPVWTYATGAAMSCGFLILISGHKRFAYELSTPLYHQVGGGTNGKVKDVEDNLFELKRLQNKLEEITLKKTKISKKKLEQVYKEKYDWYMTAEEALELGVVDEIV